MAKKKQSQKLYSNPALAKTHEVGAKVEMVQPIIIQDIKSRRVKIMVWAIVTPYNFFLNICQNHEELAEWLLKSIKENVAHQKDDGNDMPFVENEQLNVFLSEAVTAIVFGIAAIESMANFYISQNAPEDKKENYLNNVDLHSKLKIILPKIIWKHPLTKNTKLWNKFSDFEIIRNEIIHSKIEYFLNIDEWDKTLISKLMNRRYKGITQCAFDIIQHFHIAPPPGPGKIRIVDRALQANPL